MKDSVVHAVLNNRHSRMIRSAPDLVEAREQEFRLRLELHRALYTATELLYFPNDDYILLTKPFDDTIHAERENWDDGRYSEAISHIPSVAAEWIEKIRTNMTSVTGEAHSSSTETSKAIALPRLNLACAVFMCSSYQRCIDPNEPLIIGEEDVLRHQHADPRDSFWGDYYATVQSGVRVVSPSLHFRPKESAMARSLVRLAGLEELEATPEEMDDLGTKYMCSLCSFGRNGGPAWMTWRECVSDPCRYVSSLI